MVLSFSFAGKERLALARGTFPLSKAVSSTTQAARTGAAPHRWRAP
jgi:hypothetical protein